MYERMTNMWSQSELIQWAPRINYWTMLGLMFWRKTVLFPGLTCLYFINYIYVVRLLLLAINHPGRLLGGGGYSPLFLFFLMFSCLLWVISWQDFKYSALHGLNKEFYLHGNIKKYITNYIVFWMLNHAAKWNFFFHQICPQPFNHNEGFLGK